MLGVIFKRDFVNGSDCRVFDMQCISYIIIYKFYVDLIMIVHRFDLGVL